MTLREWYEFNKDYLVTGMIGIQVLRRAVPLHAQTNTTDVVFEVKIGTWADALRYWGDFCLVRFCIVSDGNTKGWFQFSVYEKENNEESENPNPENPDPENPDDGEDGDGGNEDDRHDPKPEGPPEEEDQSNL